MMRITRRLFCAAFLIFTMAACSSANAQLFPTYVNGQFTLGNANGSSPYDLADTFLLESNPTATKTIYLDFDGYHSVNNTWSHSQNGGIVFDAFDRDGNVNSFSNSELIEIQRQFQNVAEDFIGFNVNVTTRVFGNDNIDKLRRSGPNDQEYGIRAVNTQSIPGGFGSGTGGIAYLNSFNWTNNDSPVFTFNKGANNGALTNSHEVGHALGLRHDGLGSQSYHPGTGSGATGWGPIMGAPFGKNLTQWSNGDYSNSTNTEDDLSIITKAANGFDFRVDDIGSTINDARSLAIGTNGDLFDWGIIERNTDLDFFELDLTQGTLDLDIQPFQDRANLDILANLYNENGVLIATSNPINDIDASFQLEITEAGMYYVSIEGTGKAGVYSDYGSLGFFTISGSFISSVPEPGSALVLLGIVGVGLIRRRR